MRNEGDNENERIPGGENEEGRCVMVAYEVGAPREAGRVAQRSIVKFYADWEKYETPSPNPTCDRCGMLYRHYYISNEEWLNIDENGNGGWLCPKCVADLLGYMPECLTEWGNVFETPVEPEIVLKALRDYVERPLSFDSLYKFVTEIYPQAWITKNTQKLLKEFVGWKIK